MINISIYYCFKEKVLNSYKLVERLCKEIKYVFNQKVNPNLSLSPDKHRTALVGEGLDGGRGKKEEVEGRQKGSKKRPPPL